MLFEEEFLLYEGDDLYTELEFLLAVDDEDRALEFEEGVTERLRLMVEVPREF